MHVGKLYALEKDDFVPFMINAGLSTLITSTSEGLFGTPLPLIYEPDEGPHGTLYGHLARGNEHWQLEPLSEAMVVIPAPDHYISPSWWPSKQEHGKAVPTWNYIAIHAYGPAEIFEDKEQLLKVVTKLSLKHEPSRSDWQVSDAPADYVDRLLKGIVGVRIPLTRIDAKKKMDQNHTAADRKGEIEGLKRDGAPEFAALVDPN